MFGREFRRATLFHALVDGMFSIFALGLVVVLVGCGGAASGSLPAAASVSEATAAEDQATIEKLMKGSARLEKAELKLGFIKLTDCAPLVIAKEQGFFTDEGLSVQLEAQANWKILLDRVISGELDGAHMLAGQPIGATIGIGTKAYIITACGLDLNGNGITVSNRVWEAMQAADAPLNSPTPPHPISAAALKPVVEQFRAEGRDFNFGMVFPLSTHNYELRYWLAAGGLSPGFYTRDDMRGIERADVVLSVTPPPQMPATLEAGTIQGYCVGEPWNQQAVARGIGVSVITDGYKPATADFIDGIEYDGRRPVEYLSKFAIGLKD